MRSLCAPYWVYDINTKNALHLHQHRLSSTVRNASAHKVRARCESSGAQGARKVRHCWQPKCQCEYALALRCAQGARYVRQGCACVVWRHLEGNLSAHSVRTMSAQRAHPYGNFRVSEPHLRTVSA